MPDSVEIYDTTLRDGTQAVDFNLSLEDKLKICRELDSFGLDYIEGGWPGANPQSVDFFERMKAIPLKHARLVAFGSTRHFHNTADKDPNLAALVAAQTPAVTIFGKSWKLHVAKALRISPEDNLALIADSLAWLKKRVAHVFYDAEHFFDGFKADKAYALQTLATAFTAGADRLVLCDTNGGTLPHDLQASIKEVRKFFQEKGLSPCLGIHAHNDAECAVANSLMALHEGVRQVQGTINGYGERCGNANLTSIIPAIELKLGLRCQAGENLKKLYAITRMVNELANLPHNRYQPYVGEAAFAHKAGIHVSALQRSPLTYEHIEPEKVGNERRILISDQAGRASVLLKAECYGLHLEPSDVRINPIVSKLKEMENRGYQFEAAEASFELLMRQELGEHHDSFELLAFSVTDRYDKRVASLPGEKNTEATVRIREPNGKEVHTASMGVGPVDALDHALRKALKEAYPENKKLNKIKLIDYKVRVLSGPCGQGFGQGHGTDAGVRVLIESRDETTGQSWSTIGVSANIIEASWQALEDSINYKLMKDGRQKKNGDMS